MLDRVAGELVGDPEIASPIPPAQLGEQLREPRPRNLAPALGAEVAPRTVEIEGTESAGRLTPGLERLEAAAGQLELGLAALAAATRDDVDGAGQGVAAERSDRSADHVDSFDVVQWDEVEVHLRRVRLVHSHTV